MNNTYIISKYWYQNKPWNLYKSKMPHRVITQQVRSPELRRFCACAGFHFQNATNFTQTRDVRCKMTEKSACWQVYLQIRVNEKKPARNAANTMQMRKKWLQHAAISQTSKTPQTPVLFSVGPWFLDSKQEEIKAILTWIYLLLSIRVLIWALPTDWRRKTPRIELFVWQAIILYYLITDLAPAIFLGLALCSWVPLGDRFKLSLTFCKTWCMSIYI